MILSCFCAGPRLCQQPGPSARAGSWSQGRGGSQRVREGRLPGLCSHPSGWPGVPGQNLGQSQLGVGWRSGRRPQMPVIMRCGSWSGVPSRPGEVMARAGAARLHGDKAQAGRQYLSTCPFSTPGVRAAGEMRETANVRNCTVLCYPHAPNAPPPQAPITFASCLPGRLGRGSGQAGVGAWGGYPAAPSPGVALTHAHAHMPHASMHNLPQSASGERLVSTSHLFSDPSGKEPKWELWRSQAKQDSPQPSAPLGPLLPEVSRAFPARLHNTPLLALLPANRNTEGGREENPVPRTEPRPARRGC